MTKDKRKRIIVYVIFMSIIVYLGISYAIPFFAQDYKLGEGIVTSKILQNKMGVLPSNILAVKDTITEIHFVDNSRSNIRDSYEDATIKADLTLIESGEKQGLVLCWVEDGIIYIESHGPTYVTIPNQFQDFNNATVFDTTNADFSLVDPVYAVNIGYDNSISGINCDNFQCAVEQINAMLG